MYHTRKQEHMYTINYQENDLIIYYVVSGKLHCTFKRERIKNANTSKYYYEHGTDLTNLLKEGSPDHNSRTVIVELLVVQI